MKTINVKTIGKKVGTLGWLADQQVTFEYCVYECSGQKVECCKISINGKFVLDQALDDDDQCLIDYINDANEANKYVLTKACSGLLKNGAKDWIERYMDELDEKEASLSANLKLTTTE